MCNLFDDRGKNVFHDKVNELYYNWLKEKLVNSKNFDFIFVIGHHTIISQMSGRNRSECMNKVNLMLLDFGVICYISGHDHTLQYNILKNGEEQTIHYLISGAGSSVYKKPFQSITSKNIKNNFYWNDEHAKAGFLTLSLHSDSFRFDFHDSKSNNLYSNRIYLKKSLNTKSKSKKSCASNFIINLIFLNFIIVHKEH